jgi:hypothetical protein
VNKQEQERGPSRLGDKAHRSPKPNDKGNSALPPLSHLQKAAGNQALLGMLEAGAIKPKLRVSQPEDADEVEADRIAEQVTSEHSGAGTEPSTAAIPLSPAKHATDLHREISSAGTTNAPDDLLQNIGPGQALDPAVRKTMESRFGQDFSGVRIHSNSRAAESARSVNARAFTLGRDIVFDTGEYSPSGSAGQQLLAHELTHIVQQGASHVTSGQVAKPLSPGRSTAKVQRQPAPTGQPAASGSQLTQALYNQAVAALTTLPNADKKLIGILQQGKVGQRVLSVKAVASNQQVPAPGGTPSSSAPPAISVVFDLEISADASKLPSGAFAQFVEDPANQTTISGTAATGFKFTRLLRIITKSATGPNTTSDLASALLHEGTHMLLGIDRQLEQVQNVIPDPAILAAMGGGLKAFNQYQQAAKRSSKRAALVSSLIAEIGRVLQPAVPAPAGSAASSAAPPSVQSPVPSASAASSAAPPSVQSPAPSASAAPSATPPVAQPPSFANNVADVVIDTILEERFVFDQGIVQNPQRPAVTSPMLAREYLFLILGKEAGRQPWPASPNAATLLQRPAELLDDVEVLLSASAPKPTPSGKSSAPNPSPPPKTP